MKFSFKVMLFNFIVGLLSKFDISDLEKVEVDLEKKLSKKEKEVINRFENAKKVYEESIKNAHSKKSELEEELHLGIHKLQTHEDKVRIKCVEDVKKITLKKDIKVAKLLTAKDVFNNKINKLKNMEL